MKVLVTGGNGFIGRYLRDALRKEGHAVRIIDVSGGAFSGNHGCEHVTADILDARALEEAARGVDLIFHLAAKHRFFGVSKEEYHDVNVTGTENLLKAATAGGCERIVFFSSVAVYGSNAGTTDESTVPEPDNHYGITKRKAEERVEDWVSGNGNRSAIVIRPTVVYGPHNKGNVYRLIWAVDRGLFLPVGKGVNVKSVAYVENLVNATMFLVGKGLQEGIRYYNYSDEPEITFREFLEKIYGLLGRGAPRLYLPHGPARAFLRLVDYAARKAGATFPLAIAADKITKSTYHKSRRIREEGYVQDYSMEEGLSRMVDWYRNRAATEENR